MPFSPAKASPPKTKKPEPLDGIPVGIMEKSKTAAVTGIALRIKSVSLITGIDRRTIGLDQSESYKDQQITLGRFGTFGLEKSSDKGQITENRNLVVDR
jgi:hypothetical protein